MDGFRHITPIEVRFRDLDVFGHVNNGVIFTYIETARIRYLVDVDIRSPRAGWNDIAFILAHINCDFRQPIFYGQRVEVGSRIVDIGRTSMRLAHRIEADGKLAAEGDGILVHYDYNNQCSTPIPAEMRAKIEAFEQGSKVAE
ncbi:MAG: thioesterase family protein [Anaerolineae bacterium]|nr:acyl-CoA thioesterase [Anaerolineales bacterium]MCQ3974027.1 acyl-CoA thioesterase [Anaerolineae bacterium]